MRNIQILRVITSAAIVAASSPLAIAASQGDNKLSAAEHETVISINELDKIPEQRLEDLNVIASNKPTPKIYTQRDFAKKPLARSRVTLQEWDEGDAIYIGPSRAPNAAQGPYQPAKTRRAMHPEGRFVEPMQAIAEAGVKLKF